MKKRKLKELSLSVGSSPEYFPQTDFGNVVGYGGYRSNADTDMSRRMSVTHEQDEDEDLDKKRKKSIRKKKKKMKNKLLIDDYFYEEENLNEDILSLAGHTLKAFGKSLIGAVPYLDAAVGTMFVGSAALNVRRFSGNMSDILELPDGYFGKALKNDSNAPIKSIIERVKELKSMGPELVEKLRKNFNKILASIKELMITFVESYDTLATTILSGGASLPFEVPKNLFVGIKGFAARMVPVERFLFDMVGKFAEALETLIGLFIKSDDSKIKGKMKSLTDKGGSVVEAFLFHPVRTLSRLSEFYEVIDDGSSAKVVKALGTDAGQKVLKTAFGVNEARRTMSLMPLFENYANEEDEDDESFDEIDLEEYSSVGGGSLGKGPVPPIGDSDRGKYKEKKKALNEQRERVALLQAYHQRTTNRLK